MDWEIIKAAVKIIIMLPLVTALAYFLIKYGLARRYSVGGQFRRMRIVEQMPIGPKAFMSLVEVGGRYTLLAHSDSGFLVVREMDALPDPLPFQVNELTELKSFLESFKNSAAGRALMGKILSRNQK